MQAPAAELLDGAAQTTALPGSTALLALALVVVTAVIVPARRPMSDPGSPAPPAHGVVESAGSARSPETSLPATPSR